MDKNRYDFENGYKVFKDTRKPFHRWVAEKKYGKEYISDKEIHHIDQDKLNNDDSNLIALLKKDHYNLTQHNNKVNFFLDVIIILGAFYFMSVWIFKEMVSGAVLRIMVILMTIFAIELRSGFFTKMIKRPKEQ